MKLIDVLKLIDHEYFPPVMEMKNGKYAHLDTRPESVFNVTLCFMSEEETWITCNIQNEILIPWYDCEVESIQPCDIKYSICIWLKDDEYLMKNFSNCLVIDEKE